MKKIALISDGWKRYITYSWLEGIMQRAEEVGLDVCVFGFNTNGNLSHDPKYNQGEYNLYNLPNYESYDGIVFDCTNTTDPEQIAWIVEKLRKTNVPVVSICYYVEGFYYVGNDNKCLFEELIDHLYYVHHIRNMVFAGGPKDNYENKQRHLAFLGKMEEFGLPLHEDSCLFGDFDFDTGVRYLKEWLDAGKSLPEAFVCANDNIAAGICFEANNRGLSVPKDFLVTGFDNLDKAAYYKPQITTVEHNRGNISKNALQILMDVWDGKKVEPFTYLYSEMIPGESCGCANNGRVNYRDYAKNRIDWSVVEEHNDNAVVELENRIAECESYEDLFTGFAGYMKTLKCGAMFITVDRALLEASLDNKFPTSGYDYKKMVVVYASENGERLYNLRSMNDLVTYLNQYGSNCGHLCFPIHFRDEVVGFTLLKNPDFLFDYPFFYDVHATFITKLQSIYKQAQLENAARRMKELYNRDPLTGLYNRGAYNEIVSAKFKKFHAEKVQCAIVFFDVDQFKEINDTLGHDFGDVVLVTIAKILEECKPKDGITFRFGGDEFVEFFPYASDRKVSRFADAVTECLKRQNIIVSHGVIITEPETKTTLDEYLVRADQRMYEVKQARKADTTRLTRDITPAIDMDEDRKKFWRGVDISSLPERLDGGAKFYDQDGTEMAPFDLLQANGVNSVRLRIWNEPENEPESKNYCDLAHTLAMAKEIKEHDMHFVLDFHYSDYWADPGQQRKPKAWEKLSFEELVNAVHDYTMNVLTELAKIDCLPDVVQIGNEIRSGMLFPDGAVPHFAKLAKLINAGIHAVREISPDIEVMIHLDQGGRFYYLKEWFDAMFSAGMEKIDVIGISFYSFWHGTYMDLRDCMKQLMERYELPVYVVETAHPWRQQGTPDHVPAEQMKTAGMLAGIEEQKKALQIIMQLAAEASGSYDTGVYYWEPLCITNHGYGSWDQQMGMLDDEGKALPSFDAYKNYNPEKPALKDLDGFIHRLYEVDESKVAQIGTNLVPNGDFADGTTGWWITKYPDTIEVRENENEIFVSSDRNFTFRIFREIRIERAGKYTLSVDYRGTNTTGVHVNLFLKTISCNGEKEYLKEIYPSDVRFDTYSLTLEDIPVGPVQLGISLNAPPVFGRIQNIRLVEEAE